MLKEKTSLYRLKNEFNLLTRYSYNNLNNLIQIKILFE